MIQIMYFVLFLRLHTLFVLNKATIFQKLRTTSSFALLMQYQDVNKYMAKCLELEYF